MPQLSITEKQRGHFVSFPAMFCPLYSVTDEEQYMRNANHLTIELTDNSHDSQQRKPLPHHLQILCSNAVRNALETKRQVHDACTCTCTYIVAVVVDEKAHFRPINNVEQERYQARIVKPYFIFKLMYFALVRSKQKECSIFRSTFNCAIFSICVTIKYSYGK